MNIYPANSVALKISERDNYTIHLDDNSGLPDADNHEQTINLQQELNDAAEEMADMLSSSGRRFSKGGRKSDSIDEDYVSIILEENGDEKFDTLVKQIPRLLNFNNVLNFARNLFPNDSDLMLALRELLLSRKLSELQKRKVKEAIVDLEQFGDKQKIQSGINVGCVAKKFSGGHGDKRITPTDLRYSYLLFLELDLVPPSYIFQGWIEQYGFSNRKRLLSFTLSALIADMKSNEPGIHFSEFGPLSSKLSDARTLHSLDETVSGSFCSLPFWNQMRNNRFLLEEKDIVSLYMTGLINSGDLKDSLRSFGFEFMSLLNIKEKIIVMHTLRNVFSLTPDFLYSEIIYRDVVLEIMLSVLSNLYKIEIDCSHLDNLIQ